MSNDEILSFLQNLEEVIETPAEDNPEDVEEPRTVKLPAPKGGIQSPPVCPECHGELKQAIWQNHTLERCLRHGLWMPWEEAHGLFFGLIKFKYNENEDKLSEWDQRLKTFVNSVSGAGSNENECSEVEETLTFLGAINRPQQTPKVERPCPLCQGTMQVSNALGVELDVCEYHGVWFDRGELKAYVKTVKKQRSIALHDQRRIAEAQQARRDAEQRGAGGFAE